MKEISKSMKMESEQKQRKRLSTESRRSRNGVRIVDPNTDMRNRIKIYIVYCQETTIFTWRNSESLTSWNCGFISKVKTANAFTLLQKSTPASLPLRWMPRESSTGNGYIPVKKVQRNPKPVHMEL